MQTTHHYRYVIVGAGISALQAALILAEHGQSFIILQASERIGGRICSLTLGEATKECPDKDLKWLQHAKESAVDCGATWICEDHLFMLHFVKEFGLTLTEQFYDGLHVLAEAPGKYHHVANLSEYYAQFAPQIKKLMAELKKLRLRQEELINKKNSKALSAEEENELNTFYFRYGNTSGYDFIKEQVEDEYLTQLLAKEAATLLCCNVHQCSVIELYDGEEEAFANIKFYIGLQNANIDGFRLHEGMVKICEHLRAASQKVLDQRGQGQNMDSLIQLNTPVVEIRNGKVPVEVVIQNGTIYTCQKVISCLPSATFHRIKFQTISQSKRLLVENQTLCNMTRMAMVFPEPFWRKTHAGYVSFSHKFPMNEVVDLTPAGKEYGILALVFTAEGFSQWNEEVLKDCRTHEGEEGHQQEWYEVNKSKVLRIVADIYLAGDINSPHLKEVAIFHRSLSKYPYIKSTYQSITAKSTVYKINQTGEELPDGPEGDEPNVVVLGSDFSDEFAGFMEGAVRLARKKIFALCGSKDPLQHFKTFKSFRQKIEKV